MTTCIHATGCACQVAVSGFGSGAARVSLALAAARMGLWEIDLETDAGTWSQEGFPLFGHEPFDGSLGRFVQWVHEDDQEGLMATVRHAIDTHDSFEFEFRWQDGDGAWHWLVNRGQAEYRPDGTASRLFGTLQDITEARQAVAELNDSEQRFRQLAESIQEVFWLTNVKKTEIIYISPGYEEVWGRTRESLFANPMQWLEAIHSDDRDRVAAALEVQDAGDYHEIYRVLRPDGEVRWVRDRAFQVKDAAGKVFRIAGVAEDITHQRELESQLRHTQKMQSIGELAGGVAHDFNNLLTVISTATELMEDMIPADHESVELLGEIRLAQQRATSLTRQLLAFSRRDVANPRFVDVDEAVAETEKMLRRLLGEDIVLTSRLAATGAMVRIDPGQLVQVLMNLAVNARDAMPTGGTLEIATGVEPAASGGSSGHVCLSVRDNGPGMPEEIRSRVFEPFFTTKEVGNGTGMGLSVVHGIVEQNGGSIQLESEAGKGAEFRIRLPIVSAELPATPQVATANAGGSETIMVVEDEDSVRAMLEKALRRFGYKVLAANGARQALELIESGARFDLLITDIVMPDMSGGDLVQLVQERIPGTRVLFSSGYTDDAIVRNGIRQSEVQFLAKPYTLETLASRVREALVGHELVQQ